MSLDSSPSLPIPPDPPQNDTLPAQNDTASTQAPETITTDCNTAPAPISPLTKSNRPSRACTIRASQRLYAQQQQAANERRQKQAKKEHQHTQQQKQIKDDNDGSSSPQQQCCSNSKIVTSLVAPPEPSQLPRWTIRSMWELASVLNFLHVFRPLLNISVEFSAEEFETALITPNDTLADIHMPLMKAIPPVTRMPLTRDTWITVLCRKLRDWWHWVADGDLPIVASHGAEIEVYKSLDPGVRVVILKALCDIRVEQEDIRNYIDNSLKHGVQLSAFRKQRIGGDSQGINYWYEDDAVVGHRLYREIRKVELKKAKMKGSHVPNSATYLWETIATNLEEFQDVSEKLFASKNRTEASLGKKLKNDMLPEIEKEHKRKEKLLKKQHRQALLLNNFLVVDGLGPGRSLRDRKPVTYTFDDYDRSINEAIKITKRKAPSPDPLGGRDVAKPEPSANGKLSGPSHGSEQDNYNIPSPKSSEYDDFDDNKSEELDRSNRRRQRPQRYSVNEFVEAVSDNEADFDSDDDIVGEAVYDEEYLRKRKQRRQSSSSEGDEEYHWDGENAEDEEEEEEDSLSISEDSDEAPKVKKLPGRTRRGTKLRSVDELQSGLRRSKRATRNRINYKQYELSESETDSKPEKPSPSNEHSDASEDEEFSEGSKEFNGSDEDQEMEVDPPMEEGMEGNSETVEKEQSRPPEQSSGSGQDEADGERKPRFLDLNELAPGSGCDEGPNTTMKDDDRNDF
ncbi:DDT-RELATED PROTEIN4 [Hibiscus trionum]|uniref:DDT-RELATED PROTEIN4 n=1 Tax=Hibiscus trionum TaxID=183268 RepID=A0A9W7J062_HIBTR|nr:DDT-RELATED PROTEIN4 [Hibiscus trionum]